MHKIITIIIALFACTANTQFCSAPATCSTSSTTSTSTPLVIPTNQEQAKVIFFDVGQGNLYLNL